ncbi:branched-chain amino acid ABC transporter permease [Oscillospiraceae bacterium MB08-C2-2]|nr:branched-chain amino acid ABC transporter permease [Oscillospiraceae bacterium MB08-C2-2]
MATVIQLLVYGLQLGSVYALLALGYTMVYGIVGMINFAHGDFLMLGALGTVFLAQAFSFMMVNGTYPLGTVLLTILIAMLCLGFLGVLVEAVAYKPLRNRPRMTALITAVGISMFLQNFPRALPFVGPNPRPFPKLFTVVQYNIGGVAITSTQIIMIALSLILMVVLYVFVNKTRLGSKMRAVSMDKEAAALVGININFIISLTFFIGAAFAAASGIFYASIYPQVEVYMGTWLGTKSFIAAVLGGIGDIRGAMLGGIIMGVTEIYATSINSDLGYAIGFIILIVILLVKPAGIMGKFTIEKV